MSNQSRGHYFVAQADLLCPSWASLLTSPCPCQAAPHPGLWASRTAPSTGVCFWFILTSLRPTHLLQLLWASSSGRCVGLLQPTELSLHLNPLTPRSREHSLSLTLCSALLSHYAVNVYCIPG